MDTGSGLLEIMLRSNWLSLVLEMFLSFSEKTEFMLLVNKYCATFGEREKCGKLMDINLEFV
jgi:hypothetical protein